VKKIKMSRCFYRFPQEGGIVSRKKQKKTETLVNGGGGSWGQGGPKNAIIAFMRGKRLEGVGARKSRGKAVIAKSAPKGGPDLKLANSRGIDSRQVEVKKGHRGFKKEEHGKSFGKEMIKTPFLQ